MHSSPVELGAAAGGGPQTKAGQQREPHGLLFGFLTLPHVAAAAGSDPLRPSARAAPTPQTVLTSSGTSEAPVLCRFKRDQLFSVVWFTD